MVLAWLTKPAMSAAASAASFQLRNPLRAGGGFAAALAARIRASKAQIGARDIESGVR